MDIAVRTFMEATYGYPWDIPRLPLWMKNVYPAKFLAYPMDIPPDILVLPGSIYLVYLISIQQTAYQSVPKPLRRDYMFHVK